MGVQMALLFDRLVDGATAQQAGNYQIPSNAIQQARSQLSGRIVVANLQVPEGPYVPTSVTVSGMADSRGVVGPSGTQPMQSRLQDPGAVVSGRVFNADGTAVGAAVITYSGQPTQTNPDCQLEQSLDAVGFANFPVNSDGRYELRYAHQDQCGFAFNIATQDPNTGGLRQVSSFARIPGEHQIIDLP